MQSDPENLKALVSKVARWIVVNRWKKAIWCAISVQKCKNFHCVLWYTYGGRGGGGGEHFLLELPSVNKVSLV
jgi:hypothetical protein